MRYGQPEIHVQDFLGSRFAGSTLAEASASPCGLGIFNRLASSSQPSIAFYAPAGAGILNLLSIAYALRPQLRSRLTPGGRAWPGKPWVYGGLEFNQSFRYSCLHSHLFGLHSCFRSCFKAQTTLPYHVAPANWHHIQSFGIPLIANHFRRKIAR